MRSPSAGLGVGQAAVAAAAVAGIYSGRFDETTRLVERFLAETEAPTDGSETFVHLSIETVPVMVALVDGDHAGARAGAERTLATARRIGSPSGLALDALRLRLGADVRRPGRGVGGLRGGDRVSCAPVRATRRSRTCWSAWRRSAPRRVITAALADLREALTWADDVGSRITTLAVLDYGMRILASLGEAELRHRRSRLPR